ncbi:MAG TPA: NTP pyrophosphohydrolase [Bacteroidales bacterium]|nr:NTP pyrophosphohydrolase [Bacteroidales bacterium]
MSKEAWAFISGGLFYIIFAGYFVFEFVKNKFRLKHLKSEEWLPIVDEDGNVKAKAPRSICHRNKELLHPVVHLHVVNKKGEFFLQKRPANKLIQPDKWDTSVGGHVSFNETIEQALKKEAIEELGIVDFKPIFVKKYIWESDVERELVFMFYTQYEGIVKINKNELADGKFWRILDIDNQINKDIFTPNFLKEFEIIRTYLS